MSRAFRYARGWLCYQIVILLPGWRWQWAHRLSLAIVPYAGEYAYWLDTRPTRD